MENKFTLVELLVVIAIISILAGMLLPALSRARQSAHQTNCAGNLRQIGFGILQYTMENEDSLPLSRTEYTPGSGYNWHHRKSPLAQSAGWNRIPEDVYYRTNSNIVLNCPAATGAYYMNENNGDHIDYASSVHMMANKYQFTTQQYPVTKTTSVRKSSLTFLMADRKNGDVTTVAYSPYTTAITWCQEGGGSYLRMQTDRHGGKFNILWGDGHTASRRYLDLFKVDFDASINPVP